MSLWPTLTDLEIKAELGKGGMATVYLAYSKTLQKDVAVKVLHPEYADQQKDIADFACEARIGSYFDHPSLLHVYAIEQTDKHFWFVMDFVRGYTLNDWLLRKGKLPIEDVLTLFWSVADALNYAWQNFQLVHCDLKPENLMVDIDGVVKITDLGIARSFLTPAVESLRSLDDDDVQGTPNYMSPEQLCGTESLDCRSDIYSLATTLYHLSTGRQLFEMTDNQAIARAHFDPIYGPDIRSIDPDVPMGLAIILHRMLAKDPNQRYGDWEALLHDLNAVLADQGFDAFCLDPGESSMIFDPNL